MAVLCWNRKQGSDTILVCDYGGNINLCVLCHCAGLQETEEVMAPGSDKISIAEAGEASKRPLSSGLEYKAIDSTRHWGRKINTGARAWPIPPSLFLFLCVYVCVCKPCPQQAMCAFTEFPSRHIV
jgi:hypothetical protein